MQEKKRKWLFFSREKKIRWFCSHLSVFGNKDKKIHKKEDGSGFFNSSKTRVKLHTEALKTSNDEQENEIWVLEEDVESPLDVKEM